MAARTLAVQLHRFRVVTKMFLHSMRRSAKSAEVRRRKLSFVLVIAFSPIVWLPNGQIFSAQADGFERLLNVPPKGTLSVSLQSASANIRAWPAKSVYIIGRRTDGAGKKPFASLISAVAGSGGVRISVAGDERAPVELFIYMPEAYGVDVKSGSGAVSLAGNTGKTVVRTDSGNVSVTLSSEPGASIDAKTMSGRVEAKIPVRIIGEATAGFLAGTIGAGGRQISIDSRSGNIFLLPQTAAEMFQRPRTMSPVVASAPHVAATTTSPSGIQVRTAAAGPDESAPASRDNPPAPRRPPVLNSASSPVLNKDDVSPAGETSDSKQDDRNPDVIRLESRLITLNVKVSDRSGKAVSTLAKDDFRVYEDGVEQEVSFFDPVTAPIDLVLLLDLSGSIKEKRHVLKRAAVRFISELSAADRVAVMTFTRRFQVISGLTADRSLLSRRIESIKAGDGGTSFYDALWRTVEFLKSNTSSRRQAIVVLTDGVDSSLDDFRDYRPEHPFEEGLARVQESDATVYPVYLDTEKDVVERQGLSTHEAYVTARQQLRQLASATGGTLFYSARLEDLEGVYRQVISELHTLYSVSYSPSNLDRDGRFRKVRVKMRQPDLVATTRPGYYAK